MRFLEKREPIEAVCWDGTNKEEIWNACKYARFAENMEGEIEVLIPLPNNKVFNLSIGDYIVVGENGLCTPYKRNDFLYKYEEYTPDIPRVSVECDVTELDKKKPYIVHIDIKKGLPKEILYEMLKSAQQNFTKVGVKAVVTPYDVNVYQLEKDGMYYVECFDNEIAEKLQTECEVKALSAAEGSIKITPLKNIK